MPILLRYMVLSLVVLLALTASSSAQTNEPSPTIKILPLRADEIVVDTEKDRVLLRGNIDCPDGRTTTSLVITCSGKDR
jgi:hypothetical protein